MKKLLLILGIGLLSLTGCNQVDDNLVTINQYNYLSHRMHNSKCVDCGTVALYYDGLWYDVESGKLIDKCSAN